MSQAKTENEVIIIFKNVFNDVPEISKQTSADDIADWDSLNHMILIEKLEQKFNLKFDLFKLIELRSVGDFIQYISNEIDNENQGN